jgi:hypothetical protein
MSLLDYLEFQPIDHLSDITDAHQPSDDILLDEPVDEASLEKFWEQVVQDIHEDPEWFSFDNE